ncbi:MAG: rhomboid family intramembrane serine protease [Bacteroidetes bacterium]|nr:rhomboid family intramembrane serine protease [Bacteroidota bacterium]
MGESERYQDYKKLKRRRFSLGSDNNALMGLFTINVIFFIVLLTLRVGYAFYGDMEYYDSQVLQWFQLPASLTRLSERPWTLLTYFFSDTISNGNIFRIISNMLWLWAFGSILQSMAGNDKIIPVYIYGGVVGGIFFIASSYILPGHIEQNGYAALLGANTGTVAVAMATTALSPNHRFFTQIRGGIPIWVLMAVYLIIDFSSVAGVNAAHSIAHFGGALAGFAFVVLLRRGKDGSIWMNRFYTWFMHLFTPDNSKAKQPSVKDKIFYNTGNRSPYSKTSIVTQQRVDEILDKINQKGYHFLTEEEKQILKRASEEEDL